ncbi:MAG: FecR domain-containing protein [Beijerinckiaceae bacterium]|nr:FecR domain-containing protein [Beijerinckiaceae bacterium]
MTDLSSPGVVSSLKTSALSLELEAAIKWSIRLSSETASDKDRGEFGRWLKLSQAHQDAWMLLSQSLSPFGVAGRQQARRGAFAERALRHGVHRRQLLRSLVGFGIVGGMGATVTNRFVPLGDLSADHLSLTGECKTIQLEDGSALTLGPRTAVDVAFRAGTRNLFLRGGEILLKVRDEPSAELSIGTDGMMLQADAGTFVVRRGGRNQSMAAIDTAARVVCRGSSKMTLARGECISFDGTRIVRKAINIRTETSWVDGLLFVNNESLGFVIDRIRPYFAGVIRIDPAITQLPVTGVFPLNNVALALDTIAKALDVSVQRFTPYVVMIGAASPTPV